MSIYFREGKWTLLLLQILARSFFFFFVIKKKEEEKKTLCKNLTETYEMVSYSHFLSVHDI